MTSPFSYLTRSLNTERGKEVLIASLSASDNSAQLKGSFLNSLFVSVPDMSQLMISQLTLTVSGGACSADLLSVCTEMGTTNNPVSGIYHLPHYATATQAKVQSYENNSEEGIQSLWWN